MRPVFARLALFRPAFDELGVRFDDDGVRFAVEGVFARLLLAGAWFDRFVFDRFVEPERAGLERFTFPLDRDAPLLRPPPLRC